MVTLQTTINSKLGNLDGVRDLVSELEHAHSLPAAVVFDINVVLDEVLNNILKYGYADDAMHEIHLKLSATDAAVEIGIEDDGVAFDPLAIAAPDLSLPLAERPIGGLGLHFVRKLMDDVQYQRKNDRNCLFLKKKL
ncbi:MAG TPA: ATP-binding protein [Burkholderiales bacterium]|nr:ATP-binding protein [Burkholderiales bacterium]